MTKCQPPSLLSYPILCTGMRAALAGVPVNHGGKGLTLTRGWIGDNAGHPRYIGIVYKRTVRDAGTVLNICPWCGASVRFDEMTSSAAAEAAPNVEPK